MSNIGNISLLLGQPQQSKVYNVSQTHPLIPNSNEYVLYKKYVSIHSEDRDIIKYPNSSEFDIELPEDLLNVISIRLSTWAFPSNYSTFSALSSNINMTFKITSHTTLVNIHIVIPYKMRFLNVYFYQKTLITRF